MSSRSPSSPKYGYLRCFGPGLLQNIAIYWLLGGQCSQTRLFTQHLPSHIGGAVNVVESGASQKYRYLRCFGPGLLQNIAIYMLLGGQCSQTPLFTQHLPSHTGGAVNLVEIRGQPKVSLFTVFWARAASKHRYLHAFGRPVLPNTIIYATFAFSYWWGCKCRRDRVPAKGITIYSVFGQGCSKKLLFTYFWEASAPKHHYSRNICPLLLSSHCLKP